MNCIFGIFDVLGFTSFCENCSPESAEAVLKIMDDFEAEIPEILLAGLDTKNSAPQEKTDIVKKRLRWLVFSDTIFVAMPYGSSEHPDKLKFNIIFFTVLVAYINRRMFEIGLPVRGAVHVGDVTVSKRCFAGKAIAEAHRLGQRVQIAGTIISEKANEFIFGIFSPAAGFHMMFSHLIIECDVPTGTKQVSEFIWTNDSEKMRTLCWFYLQMGRIERFNIPSDLNHFITDKFTAHGKKSWVKRKS